MTDRFQPTIARILILAMINWICVVSWTPFVCAQTVDKADKTKSAEPAAVSKARRIAVFGLTSNVIDAEKMEEINRELSLTVSQFDGLDIITQSEIKDLVQLSEQSEALSCEASAECLMKLTSAYKSDMMMTGKIGEVGGRYVISIQLIDTANAHVLARASEQSTAATLKSVVLDAAKKTIRESMGEGEKIEFEMAFGKNQKLTFAILNMQALGIDETVAYNLQNIIAVEVKQYEGVTVISNEEIREILQFEGQKQALGCSDDSCIAEVGNALGVNYLITGSVGILDDVYMVNLKLIDIRGGQTVNRVSESYNGPESELMTATRIATKMLLGTKLVGQGSLNLELNVDSVLVEINGNAVGEYPTIKIPQLDAGKHAIKLSSEDFYPAYAETYIEPGRTTTLHLQLESMPTPWYQSWWFWTITGVVVAGAATATAVILTLPNDSGGTKTGTIEGTFPDLEQ